MAFPEQASHPTVHRPQYQHQQFPFSQRSYTTEYGYVPEQQDFHSRPQPGPLRQYPDHDEASGGSAGHEQNRWGNANGDSIGRRDTYEDRGRNDSGMAPVQRPVEAQSSSHPRTQGPSRSKSRPPERNQYQRLDTNHRDDDFSKPLDYQQRCQPEQAFPNHLNGRSNTGFDHEDTSYSHRNNQDIGRQYGTSAHSDHQYHNPQTSTEEWGKRYPHRPFQNVPQLNHDLAPDVHQARLQEPSRSAHDQPSGISSRSESSQRSKASSKRILETPMSPDTVAWDNPFPTFPLRPKKGVPSGSKTLDNSMVEGSSRDEHHRHNSHDDRPATASSISSSYTIPQPQGIDVRTSSSRNQRKDYFDRNVRAQVDPPTDRAKTHEVPKATQNTYPGGRINQLEPPAVTSSHSEEDQTRPMVSTDPSSDLGYKRSRTMPAAISETVMKPRSRQEPALQTSWQEPGLVAGYYGPEDRGYTPTSPHGAIDSSHPGPYGQLRGDPDEKRPFGHAAVQHTNPNGRHLHTPQDSLGDVFDDYYDGSAHEDHPPYPKTDHTQHHFAGDEEMPNFDAAMDTGASHGRKRTTDKDLQRHYRNWEHPPVSFQPSYGGRSIERSDMFTKEIIPRSRSQPNLKDRLSPRQQHDNGFDFGVPRPSPTRPPTAPGQSDFDSSGNMLAGFPNQQPRSADSGQFLGQQRVPGPMQAAGYRRDGWSDPSFRSRPPAADNQAIRRPNRFRSPLQDGQVHRPFPLGYQGNAKPDRFRSPPLRGGHHRQGPTGLPGAGHSPADGLMGNVLRPVARQHNGRSPPARDGRFHNGQMGPAASQPFTASRTEPTPSPPKPPINPDALPAHPVPIRAGLTEGSLINQAAKPTPIRQYNATPSPMQLSNPSQKSGTSTSAESKRESLPVTLQEIDRLKQSTARSPDDLATQLVLAKKLVEAASVLVDERADARSRSKAREKYTFDAHKIVKKLSGNGYTEATFYLADCYTRGSLGLESDTREAFKLYQNAAKAGHAQAAYRVAVCCEIGQEEGGGTSRDPVKAMQWYKRAATLGDTPAMYKMGIISLKGLLGQKNNPREAIVWLERAAERADKENPHALHELALMHEKPNGNTGINKDEAYSTQLFTQAANLGYKFSQYRLGSAYEYGLLGCPVDPRQSIAWYSKAAVQEEHQSELALSGWYLTGSEGILQQSDTEAYLWARKAAQAGLAKAEYAMGYFTEVGIGAPSNLEDAKRWYWRAASQNFPKARDRLEDLRKGGPTKRKERVSRSNIRKSSEGECTVM